MNRSLKIFLVGLMAIALSAGDVLARGGGGGGGRGGGGGGGSRPSSAASRSPSMSRPATPSKPAAPKAAAPKTAAASKPAARPAPAGPQKVASTPGAATAPRPNTPTTARPATPNTARPATTNANRPATIGATRPPAPSSARPAGANPAVADFLQGGSTPGRVGAATAAGVGAVAAAGAGDRVGKGQTRVENRGDRPAARVAATQGKTRSSLADGRGERRTPRQQELGKNADQVRDGLREHYGDGQLYDSFWGEHSHAHYRFEQNPLFWTWAGFNTVQAFMPWNWGSESYYDYGAGGNVYYEDDTVYVGQTPVPAEQYADQAEQLATSVSTPANPDAMEWLPLGVFALTQDGNPDAVPNMFLQMALSKEGILAGTYQNKSTGQTESVEGMVDQKTQRAAWTIVGKNTPILEAGLGNLTRNETRVLAHFANGETQQWLMVHIENPNAQVK